MIARSSLASRIGLRHHRAYFRQAPLLSAIPSLAIFLVAMSLNLLGDALRGRLDPRLRGTL